MGESPTRKGPGYATAKIGLYMIVSRWIHSLNSQNCNLANYNSNQCGAMQSQTGNVTFSNQQPLGCTSNFNPQSPVFRPNTYPRRPMTSKNDKGMNQNDNAHVLGYIATEYNPHVSWEKEVLTYG